MAVTAIQIEKAVGIATILLPEVFALVSLVQILIQDSDMPEATKEELIARIKAAQIGVSEWV